jgi:hypothetical protein
MRSFVLPSLFTIIIVFCSDILLILHWRFLGYVRGFLRIFRVNIGQHYLLFPLFVVGNAKQKTFVSMQTHSTDGKISRIICSSQIRDWDFNMLKSNKHRLCVSYVQYIQLLSAMNSLQFINVRCSVSPSSDKKSETKSDRNWNNTEGVSLKTRGSQNKLKWK